MTQYSNPDDLIKAFAYQFPQGTSLKVVFHKATFAIFASLCESIHQALGEDKRDFYWTDTLGNRFKFHVTPGARSADLADLCHQAKVLADAVDLSGDTTYTNEPLAVKWWSPSSADEVLNPDQLIATLPYMFAGKNIGISFHRGWQPLFSRLCISIDRLLGPNKRNMHWVQVKEKWGSLRAYTHLDPTDDGNNYAPMILSEQQPNGAMKQVGRFNEATALGDPVGKHISDLIDATCEEATHTCCVCGRPAEIKNLGWVACLCDFHEKQFLKDRNSLPVYWWNMGSDGKKWWP